MKRLFKIFELSKHEQRVVLIVILVLIAIAFMRYERRLRRFQVQHSSAAQEKPSPLPAQLENGQ